MIGAGLSKDRFLLAEDAETFSHLRHDAYEKYYDDFE